MRLNHLDILEQCFRDKFRGYNKQEVDMFLHLVADDFKEMSEEIESLKIKIAENDNLIKDLKGQSQNGSGDSEITAEALKDKARQVMREVTEQADLQKKKALQELSSLKKEIEKLTRDKSSLIDNLKKSAHEHFDRFKK
jgi:cell division initiation protein